MALDINPKDFKEIAPGVLKKNDKTFYIQCINAGTWHYCNAARLEKLIKKHGSVEAVGANYISRNAKRTQKEEIVKKRMPKLERGKYESRKAFQRRVADARTEAEIKATQELHGKEKKAYNYLPKPPADLSAVSKNGSTILGRTQHAFKMASDPKEKGDFRCIRKDILLKNGGFCNGCSWWNVCEVPQREWRKFKEQASRLAKLQDAGLKTAPVIYKFNLLLANMPEEKV